MALSYINNKEIKFGSSKPLNGVYTPGSPTREYEPLDSLGIYLNSGIPLSYGVENGRYMSMSDEFAATSQGNSYSFNQLFAAQMMLGFKLHDRFIACDTEHKIIGTEPLLHKAYLAEITEKTLDYFKIKIYEDKTRTFCIRMSSSEVPTSHVDLTNSFDENGLNLTQTDRQSFLSYYRFYPLTARDPSSRFEETLGVDYYLLPSAEGLKELSGDILSKFNAFISSDGSTLTSLGNTAFAYAGDIDYVPSYRGETSEAAVSAAESARVILGQVEEVHADINQLLPEMEENLELTKQYRDEAMSTEIGTVREDLNQLKGDLEQLSISERIDLASSQEINGVVYSNGKWYSSSNLGYRSKLLKNKGYEKIYVSANDSKNSFVSFIKYYETPTPVDGQSVQFATGESGRHTVEVGTTESLDVPFDCTEIVVTSKSGGVSGYIPTDIVCIKPIERIKSLEEEIANANINSVTKPSFIDGYYYDVRDGKGGKKYDSNEYSSTDFINVFGCKKVTIATYIKLNDNQVGICFYDKEKTFISGIHVGNTPYTKQVVTTLDVPNGCAFMTYAILNLSDVQKDTSYYFLEEPNKEFGASVRDEIVELSKRIPNYLCSSENILCIGDSLTQGTYYVGSISYQSKKTYPMILSKMTGCNVTNGGLGGKNVIQWMSQKRIEYDFKNYDTFIIWLGTNDGLTDTLENDVLQYTDYSHYANTQTGQYCRLIEEIQNDTNNECLIVLCNVFASSGNVQITNSTIEKIYDIYLEKGYKVIIANMSDMTQQNMPRLHNLGNNHFNIAGNVYVANRIMNIINSALDSDTSLCNYNWKL